MNKYSDINLHLRNRFGAYISQRNAQQEDEFWRKFTITDSDGARLIVCVLESDPIGLIDDLVRQVGGWASVVIGTPTYDGGWETEIIQYKCRTGSVAGVDVIR